MIVGALIPEATRCQSSALTMEDLAKRADVVLVGKVTAVRSEWNGDRSRIYTSVTLAVDQQIKGDQLSNSVIISTLGGEVDGVGEVYSHMARFKADEPVVVFAAADEHGQLRVVGGDAGKLTVTKDEMTGLQMVADREPLSVYTSRLKRVVQTQSHKE